MTIINIIKQAIREDIPTEDITSKVLVLPTSTGSAHIISKATGVFFGSPIILGLQELYPELTIKQVKSDGDSVKPNDVCVELIGSIVTILGIERVLLNFIQRLSGISTITAKYVDTLNDPAIQILDTRKTTPLFRSLERQAVVAGGGYNHRFGLSDMILVKENHLMPYIKANRISEFNQKLNDQKKKAPNIDIEVEVSHLETLKLLNLGSIDIILFDNMPMDDLSNCIQYLNQQGETVLKEVSGNVSLDTISKYKGIDINRISIGSLTHSVKALDLSLLVV